MQIHWYPGHMTKARRMLVEHLKLIDVVIELIDARAPRSSRNPDFEELFAGKSRIVLLNKADLANQEWTKRWIRHFEGQGLIAKDIVSTKTGDKKLVTGLIERAAREKVERMKSRGVIKTVRVMVVGIPNVGKSTFINRIAGASRAAVGDKPGVTRGKQWVKITPYLELMDTPGLLWPKLEDEISARHLAYLGSIKDDIMDVEALANSLLVELRTLCPNDLYKRYAGMSEHTEQGELLQAVAKARGFLLAGGELDTQRASRIVLDEFRAVKIARVTLDAPPEG